MDKKLYLVIRRPDLIISENIKIFGSKERAMAFIEENRDTITGSSWEYLGEKVMKIN